MTNNEKFNQMLNRCKHPRLVYNALAGGTPNIQKLANVDMMRDQLLILQQYINVAIEGSFEECHPLLAVDWHPAKNGTLTPSMFRPQVPYKFYWSCRSCKKPIA